MKYALAVLILLFIFLVFQYQIMGLNAHNRREKCSVVSVQGTLKKATAYEYYDCLSK